jgi:hypothetical protein
MERDVGNTRTYAGNNNINKLVVNGQFLWSSRKFWKSKLVFESLENLNIWPIYVKMIYMNLYLFVEK